MTPSMGMAAPKGMAPAAPQAGLAAIAQPATAPRGMSSGNMAQVMAMARKMSDAQLADVLQGKSLDVPQYVAMTEAMGRKSLRTAMDGQQAMAQAQQPSVKQKLLMEGQQQQMPQGMPQQPVMAAEGGLMYSDGGIADLPAPNMESVDMASGGIVAFDEGGEVPRFNGQASSLIDPLQYVSMPTNPNYVPSKEESESEKLRRIIAENKDAEEKRNAAIKDFIATPSQRSRQYKETDKAPFKNTLPASPTAVNADADTQPGYTPNKELNPAAKPPAGGPTIDQINALTARPKITGSSGEDKTKAGLGATDEFSSYMDMVKKNREDYLGKLEGLGAKQREGLAKLRSEGGGEALMNLAGALFSNPNMAMALGKGMPAVAQTAAASRKEQRAVEQGANEMDLNLAKAQEAASRGDMESALMFKKMADEASYRKENLALQRAQLNKPDSGIAMLNALKDPANMAIYQKMYESRNPTNVLDRDKAATLWEKLSRKDKLDKYGNDFEMYYKSMNNNLLSATIPGQGANVIGAIK